MDRARRLAIVLSILVSVLGLTVTAVPTRISPSDVAAVGWPVSDSLLLAEVVTGGASASDEFVEVTNSGPAPADLYGLELVYATSSGSTVTRKATWAAHLLLGPGRHLLLANVAGAYAGLADATWSGGLAATGGAVALRVVSGAVIDAVGWGDATNSFVEGTATAAPPARSSIERRPGGPSGNVTDTNDNLLDWFVQPTPGPQDLASDPIPSPEPSAVPSPSPDPTVPPSAEPSPTATLDVTPTPGPTTTPAPSATPDPSPTPAPTATADPSPPSSPIVDPTITPEPTPDVTPTPEPTPTPTATPTPTPTPTPTDAQPIAIAIARGLQDGEIVTLEGVLTTALGATEVGRGAFIQDASAGIGLYLDQPPGAPLARGALVRMTGILGTRYDQRVLRVDVADIRTVGAAQLPTAVRLATGDATEAYEGIRVDVSGTVAGSPSVVTDGLSLSVDDGSGSVRVIVSSAAVPEGLASGATIRVVGPLGQRAASSAGGGYRVFATESGDLAVVAAEPSPSLAPTQSPSPEPTATPTPEPTATPTPLPTESIGPSPSRTASPAPSATPGPTGSAGPGTILVREARALPPGTRVHVSGIVTGEPGRFRDGALLAIQDGDAGIFVRLAASGLSIDRGRRIELAGVLAAPYGQLEIRAAAGDISIAGMDVVPPPLDLAAAPTEAIEGTLAALTGELESVASVTGKGDLTAILVLMTGERVSIRAAAVAGVTRAVLHPGAPYRLSGIVGQRATGVGRLDGYRLWLRDVSDVAPAAPGPSPDPTPSGSPGSSGSPAPSDGPVMTIAEALVAPPGPVSVQGVVTVPAGLLDSARRLIVIQDASAAIEVRLPADVSPPALGRLVTVLGTVGQAYGAPRLSARTIGDLGAATLPAPVDLAAAPTGAVEWRLVRIRGVLASVRATGKRWRAELDPGAGGRVAVDGLEAAGIPANLAVVGATIEVIGIVRRPHPTATDRRFAVLPRWPADMTVIGGGRIVSVPAALSPTPGAGAGGRTSVGRGGASSGLARSRAATPGAKDTPDIDLADLEASVGRLVRVGGVVVDVEGADLVVDDGTGRGLVRLNGGARAILPQLVPGVALVASGRVILDGDPLLLVTDAAAVLPLLDPEGNPANAGAASAPLGTILEPQLLPDDAIRAGVVGDAARGRLADGSVGVPAALALVASVAVAAILRRRSIAASPTRAPSTGSGAGTPGGEPPVTAPVLR